TGTGNNYSQIEDISDMTGTKSLIVNNLLDVDVSVDVYGYVTGATSNSIRIARIDKVEVNEKIGITSIDNPLLGSPFMKLSVNVRTSNASSSGAVSTWIVGRVA